MNTFSVVICAYTLDRWHEMLAAVKSIRDQSLKPGEIILVIDHNDTLFERAREQLKNVLVLENKENRGLSGARNTGIAYASGDLIAFMDEDAVASRDWLENLEPAYKNHDVLGVGGAIEPMWATGRPDWFPEEFDWVVGCTYKGMPVVSSPVRNLIGCNMSFRREVFKEIGGFRDGIGRVGNIPLGCEETELCIRARQHWPYSRFIYEPRARVSHHVPKQRVSLKYFFSRCYAEGTSKALISSLVGSKDGLETERSYILYSLPHGVLQSIKEAFFHIKPAVFERALLIGGGLAWTTTGYLIAKRTILQRGKMNPMVLQASTFSNPTTSDGDISP